MKTTGSSCLRTTTARSSFSERLPLGLDFGEAEGVALLTDLDLRSLRCLICGCQAGGETFRITQAEDGRWLAICDDCCDFFGTVSAWRRAFRIYDAIVHPKKSPDASGPT